MAAPVPADAPDRLRAAMAYKGLRRQDAAKLLDVSLPTLDRMTGSKGAEVRALTWDELWKAADQFGLPREWFTADLARLYEIVPPEFPRFAPTPNQQSAADRLRAREREAVQRARANQQDPPQTTPAQDERRKRAQG